MDIEGRLRSRRPALFATTPLLPAPDHGTDRMTIQLVINADDLGFAPGVNRGIVEAHESGTLSSASMMVTTPAFAEAVELVQTRARALGVGLHLNLITGRPLTAVPTLTDARTGELHSLV